MSRLTVSFTFTVGPLPLSCFDSELAVDIWRAEARKAGYIPRDKQPAVDLRPTERHSLIHAVFVFGLVSRANGRG